MWRQRSHPLHRRNLLRGMTAVGFSLGAVDCGGAAPSIRFFQPSFDPRSFEGRRLFLSPYPMRLEGDGYLPLIVRVRHALCERYSEEHPAVAALKELSAAVARAGVRELADLYGRLSLESMAPSEWRRYWQHTDGFLDVSVDRVLRHRVPKPATLREFGVSADYVLTFTPVRFERRSDRLMLSTAFIVLRESSLAPLGCWCGTLRVISRSRSGPLGPRFPLGTSSKSTI